MRDMEIARPNKNKFFSFKTDLFYVMTFPLGVMNNN